MRSVLVCVRTPLAAQAVANAAAQLGLSEVISTAVSGADALAHVRHKPADVLLVDTVSVRPDTVGFTRRVLERSPEAVVVFFGPEDSVVAEGAVAAGARGLIRGGDREDLVASVAKALMLLFRSNGGGTGQPVPTQRSEIEVRQDDGTPDGQRVDPARQSVETVRGGADHATALRPDAGVPTREPAGEMAAPAATSTGAGLGEAGLDGNGAAGNGLAGNGLAGNGVAGNGAGNGLSGDDLSGNGGRRTALTERELQVLRGMAEGKSNAEIGRELFVSEDTVKTHARRLFRKLAARDRAHAVAAAFRAGLVR